MTLRLNNVRVEAADPRRLAQFWIRALHWQLLFGDNDSVVIAPTTKRPLPPDCLAIVFKRCEDRAAGRSRLFFDLAPGDQDAEVRRLEELGATRSDRPTGDDRWVIMADPEGNEFCVLHPFGSLPTAKKSSAATSPPQT